MHVVLRKDSQGIHVVTGHMRIQAALLMSDEVTVQDPILGEVLIAKLPDGRLVATQHAETMQLLGLGKS